MPNWSTVAVVEYPFELVVPVSLANGVVISAIPDWIRDKEMMEGLGLLDHNYLQACRYALVKEYEASSFGDPDANSNDNPPKSKQFTALEAVLLADLSLWVANPCSIACHMVFVAEYLGNSWERIQFRHVAPILKAANESDKRLDKTDLDLARQLPDAILALPKEGTVWTAIKTLWEALKTQYWPTRYILFWVVLEALFGPEDGREITYRLSQRLGFFLSLGDRNEAQRRFQTAKNGYSWRSKLVHGRRLRKVTAEQSERLMNEAERMVRDSLTRILTTSDWIEKFDSRDREQHLENLLFQNEEHIRHENSGNGNDP